MMLAIPSFAEPEAIGMIYQFQVASDLQRWIFTHGMNWRNENPKSHLENSLFGQERHRMARIDMRAIAPYVCGEKTLLSALESVPYW
jgi:hypothetical protein